MNIQRLAHTFMILRLVLLFNIRHEFSEIMSPPNITQIHKTLQINSEYIPKYNLTFPPNQNCHVLINFAHEMT